MESRPWQTARRTGKRREGATGALFVAPAFLLLLATVLAPVGILVVLSFTDYELGAVTFRWVGLGNFEQALSDPVFRRSVTNTLLYVAIVLPGGVLLALLVALLVHGRGKSRVFYEVAYFLPVTATLIAMAAVWQFVLHPRLGPVNAVLKMLGFAEQGFLSTPSLLIPTLAFIGLWNIVGFNMVLFLAGLSSIPRDLYDAAEVDGATSAIDRFLTVTWPMLAPTTMFVVVTTSITAFKVFDTVAILTAGRDGSEVLLYAIYLEGFQYFKIGYAAALTVVFLLFMLAFSVYQATQLDRRVHYG
ncbi:sugar ABC transporter permease [Mesorhizobium sp. BAC0120]|uniref:carbohydrate ABC transporter permease n=1 Tax=Mesorhizobium sp. BAC0120 TaxID=3090670 RepID=UPI00298CC648|nr:sugar ABC transporter permease [Mesorhizobium sp. BAC0120]MDW6023049.1 sugar ABC transporter permease [Mesorhizobium sp. BAC0120]